MATQRRPRQAKGPVWWPLALILAGVILLLSNFLLLTDIPVGLLIPVALVFIGLQILFRGDLVPDSGIRTFGIRRGIAESASLSIQSGEIDINIDSLSSRHQERLIAGQYAAGTLPDLEVAGVEAHLTMQRQHTPWYTFADWEMGLSPDLPWNLAFSTSLGQIKLDASHLVIQQAILSTGAGDLTIILPAEAFDDLSLSSTLGHIYITTPPGYRAEITVEASRFCQVIASETRYETQSTGIFIARDATPEMEPVRVTVRGQYGNIYLS